MLVINMKRLCFLSFLVTLLPQGSKLFAANGLLNGVGAYTQSPIDITKKNTISWPFVTEINTTLTYSYTVINSQNTLVATQVETSTTLFKNSSVYITYHAQSHSATTGRNTIYFRFKTTQDSNERTHSLYFYGYVPNEIIDLNNAPMAFAKFESEVQFIYNGYERGTTTHKKTNFRTSAVPGNVYFPHDFYFRFNELYLNINANYSANFYKEAILYFYDYSLFPLLSRVSGKAALPLKIVQNGTMFNFSSRSQLYVDPNTHLMRSEYRSGFVATDTLYFPLDRFGAVDTTLCSLEITKFGFHEFTLVYEFTIDIGAPFLKIGGLHEAIIERY